MEKYINIANLELAVIIGLISWIMLIYGEKKKDTDVYLFLTLFGVIGFIASIIAFIYFTIHGILG